MGKVAIEIGQVWRDTYGDKRCYSQDKNKRTIQIDRDESDDGVGRYRCKVLTDVDGAHQTCVRYTTVSEKTLRAGYVLVE